MAASRIAGDTPCALKITVPPSGIDWLRRFRQRFPRVHTPVKRLYLTGQDVVTCGVAGALAAGFLTASVMLRRNLLAAAKS